MQLGTNATEAEVRGYNFQPVAMELQGCSGESGEIFITRLCKMLCRSHDNLRADSFLKQRISMALWIGNATCVLGTVSNRGAFEEFCFTKVTNNFKIQISAAFLETLAQTATYGIRSKRAS